MSKIRIGIDIGSDGAIAMFRDETLSYMKFPEIADQLDIFEIANFIFNGTDGDDNFHVVIEDLHSVYGSSASSNFTFGLNNGLIIGMLQALTIPFTKVAPKAWQKVMWQGVRPVELPVKVKKGEPAKVKKDGSLKTKIDTKATSLIAANRIFPKEKFFATERSRTAHDGIVDSVLMAEYCRRHF